jgi:signal transduction histidine kinase/DNA-binding response OmpR family regulator/streptogramin lyase
VCLEQAAKWSLRARVLAGLCLLAVPLGLLATTPDVRFDRISLTEGLSQSSIHTIAQCQDGFLWFGTQFGLDRFDGYRFRTLRHDPANPESLSNSSVSDLLLSSSGHMWVATQDGLNRLDTRTGKAERFMMPPQPGGDRRRYGRVDIVAEAPDGRLFMDQGGNIALWQPQTGLVRRLPYAEPLDPAMTSRRSAVLDKNNRFWLFNSAGLWRLRDDESALELVRPLDQRPAGRLHQALVLTSDNLLAMVSDHVLTLFNPDTEAVVHQIVLAGLEGDERFNAVMTSSDGALWLAMPTRLVRYRIDQDDWQVLFDGGRIQTDQVSRQRLMMVEHPNGDLWFASQNGLARFDAESELVQVFRHDPRDPYSVPPTTLGSGYTVYVDQDGTVWVGSLLGGLGRFSPLSNRFKHIHDRSGPGEIPHAGLNTIRGIAEQPLDDHEYLWLALDHGGVRRLRRQPDGGYEWVDSYHSFADPDRQLPSNSVWGVVADPVTGWVWVAERGHLVAIDGRSGRVVRRINSIDSNSGGGSNAVALAPDASALWVGTSRGALEYRFSQDRRDLVPNPDNPFLAGRSILNFLALDDGRVVAAGRPGFGVTDFVDASHDVFVETGETGYVFGLARHHEQGWWIGTRDLGLAHVRTADDLGHPQAMRMDWFDTSIGLVDNTIYAILPQADGQLWMSSNQGLMRWDPRSGDLRHFTPPDGVQSLEFSNTVAHVGPSGRFYFGGINGVNAFWPQRVPEQVSAPRLHLQNLNIRGKPRALAQTRDVEIRLAHDENDIELEWVGLQFADPSRVRYAFRLEGLDNDWIEAGQQRQVRYAGLPPGTYRFHARAANSDGLWSDDKLLLTAVVEPPPWRTLWAYLFYTVFVLGLMGLAYAVHLQRRRELERQVQLRTTELNEQQKLVRRQAVELEQALEARTRFFANISHEFRTPLTLIEASLQRLERDGADAVVVDRGRRYLRRLLRLVDQLLDLSKLRLRRERLDDKPWALAPVVNFTVEAFRSLAEQRDTRLESSIEPGWLTRCHQPHVEKILMNLITNAVKFCPEGGTIRVDLTAADRGVLLAVSDTGPGIPESEQELIFQRFHRVEAEERKGVDGAGIGLALVREATLALGGRVSLESEPGKGSCFRVFLPAWMDQDADLNAPLISTDSLEIDTALLQPPPKSIADVKPSKSAVEPLGTVLVVDDNEDLREHLVDVLSGQWNVMSAADGEQAMAMARKSLPDLIVSDLMMPRMDGFELLKALRADWQTSHIPLLLLTARQDNETRLKGLTLSADDFLSKPFDARELLIRLKRMIDNRERLRRRLLGQAATDPDERSVEPDLAEADRAFLDNLRGWLDKHCHDSDLKVTSMADALALERRTLQRKLKALTGLTPANFIRQFRLQRTMQLMLETNQSVNEIALSSGFASPQHFSRLFRETFGMPPDQWRREQVRAPKP